MTSTQNTPHVAAFDLRREKWIPVVRRDGTRDQLGLEEVLIQAHEWDAISDPLPTVEFGLYRLLVAFVIDISKPPPPAKWDSAQWGKLWRKGQFDGQSISGYFDRHDGVFNLFGANPFLQNADMSGEKAKPLAGLLHPVPSGTGANHFHHDDENDFGVSPAVAARLLATIAPFMTAGGAGLSPSINGSPPLYVLPLGANVFETLVMNTPVFDDLLVPQNDVGPTWLPHNLPVTGRAESASLAQSFTWRPRKIQFVPDVGGVCSISGEPSDVLVRTMKFSPGWGAGFDWIDPNAAYRLGDERTIMRLREGREIWRDTGPLALLKGGEHKFQRPAIISQIAALHDRNKFRDSPPLEMAIYGLRTDMKMKVFEWQRDYLRVPFPLLWEEVGQTRAQEAIELADKVANAVRRAVKVAYPREAQGNDRGFEAFANGATTLFWRNLRSAYDDYLSSLVGQTDEGVLREQFQGWRYRVRQEGWTALTYAIEDLDGDAQTLKRQTNAYGHFSRAVWALIDPEKAAQAKERKAKAKAAATII